MRREGGRIIHTNLQLRIILNLSYLCWHMDSYRCWLCCFGTGSDQFHLSSPALECAHMHVHPTPPLPRLMVRCCKSKYEQMLEGCKRKRKEATWGSVWGKVNREKQPPQGKAREVSGTVNQEDSFCFSGSIHLSLICPMLFWDKHPK